MEQEKEQISLSLIASLPLPSSPRFRCGCPVFHLWPLNCHCRPTWGRGRSSWSGVGQGPRTRPGAPLGPLPSLSYGVPHRPFRCCVEEGRQAATPVGPRSVTRPGSAARGGCGRSALAPAPGRLPHRVPPTPSRGLASSPRCWATTAEKPPCLRPEVASSALRVCAHMCECVKLGVRLSALEPLVCLTGGWPQGATLD